MQQALTRRMFLKRASLGAGSLGLGLSLTGCEPTSLGGGKRRPNFIILMTDDQRADALGVVNPMVQTPHMDVLAQSGVLFSNAYTTTSICCSSRASMFTGQHAARHNIYDVQSMLSPEAMSRTYHDQLRQAGYQTAFVGKYGLGHEKAPPQAYFDYWRGFMNQGKYENTDENGRYKHITRILGDQALDYLDTCDPKQPFCLSVSFKAPHAQDNDPRQFIPDPAYKDLYQDVTFRPPATGEDAYWNAFPDFFRENNEARKRWQQRFATPERYQKTVKDYYRLLYGVDVQIGRLREQLAKQGLADNTVILLLSDNGVFLGEHGMAGKWYAQEESIRIPFVIYDPRLPKRLQGTRSDEITLNIDVAPTLLGLARVSIPVGMQGRDISLMLRDPDTQKRHDFYYDHQYSHPNIPPCEAVVGTRWKYVRYAGIEPVYEQLFDLKNDPQETQNLVDDPKHENQLHRMQLRFKELKKQAS